MNNADLSRVLQGIIAGMGFLGAGAIIKLSEKEEIKGLTTAASIWATAAIGLGAGMGHEITAVLSALLVLAILAVLPRIERRIDRRRLMAPRDRGAMPPDATAHNPAFPDSVRFASRRLLARPTGSKPRKMIFQTTMRPMSAKSTTGRKWLRRPRGS